MENISFNPHSINNLLNQLRSQTGIEFNCYRRNFLERRIKSRMIRLNLTTDQEYLDYLLSNPQEIDLFLERFTINYSYFFRNIEIFNNLRDIIIACKSDDVHKPSENFTHLSKLSIYDKIQNALKGKKNSLKIWSCPCASGEEPYSLVMLFEELNKEFPYLPRYDITASDIDKNALNMAKKGLYGKESLKETPIKYLKTYFTEVHNHKDSKYLISDSITSKVDFLLEDITKGHKKNEKYDIIFCRYLLIYIDRDFRERLLRIIENHLVSGGLLVVGKTETLLNSKLNFKLIDGRNHFYIKV